MARVLIVEDDVTLANLIAEVLSADDHEVDVLNDGQQGANQLCSGAYELAVLDWDLPQKSGIQICQQYRDGGGKSPVLMLTGRDKVSEKEAGFEAGADDYLTKPFSLKEFRMRVKALLRRTGGYPAPVQKPVEPVSADTHRWCMECGSSFDSTSNVCPHDGSPLLSTKPDTLLGRLLDGRYSVDSFIARGGMATVYKGLHQRLKRPIAIKVMHSRFDGEDRIWLKRLQREAITVGRLNHPNIITVYDFGVTEGNLPYLVMDYIEGATLGDLLSKQKRLGLARSLRIFRQICEGLEHAHAAGLIHRDLKPSNVMLTTSNSQEDAVKVLDFGIAKVADDGNVAFEKLTQTGQVVGTCYYMSPEQCLGESVDRRSDVYSLGCLMYETLIGTPPIRGANPLATFHMHVHELPRTLTQVRPDLNFPPQVEMLVMKALEKQPDKRQQTMLEMKLQIEEALAQVYLSGS